MTQAGPTIPAPTDWAGQEIAVGDFLAVAVSEGDSANLRVGEVKNITESTLQMVWLKPTPDAYQWTKRSSIRRDLKKFYKIPEPVDKHYPEW